MKISKCIFQLLALAFILSVASATFAQDSSTRRRETSINSANARSVPDGQQLKISGIVIKRDSDAFTLREPDGTETIVALTDTTSVKTVRKGLFRADKPSGVSYILRGLRLKVEGRGNGEGQLVATKIRFDEDDLRTAQALEARVDPVDDMATSNKTLPQGHPAPNEEG